MENPSTTNTDTSPKTNTDPIPKADTPSPKADTSTNANTDSNTNANETANSADNNGGNTAQEVSSTTQAMEPNKRALRVKTWHKLRDNKLGINGVYNRIPNFVGSDKAAMMLAETEEFQNAKDIKVMLVQSLHPVRSHVVSAGKNLYLPSARGSKALFWKVNVPADATEEQKADVFNNPDLEKCRTEIFIEDKVHIDMIIIGSVVASRDGYRIGCGRGYNDLDIGLLIETGAISGSTIIVTLVHDVQVVDTLPANLFQKQDAPIDMIVTPNEVIRVANPLLRPKGIFWELLFEGRLRQMPVLQALKELRESEGATIELRKRTYRPYRLDVGRPRYFRGRYQQRRTYSQNDNEQSRGGNRPQQRSYQPRRRFNRFNRRRRPFKSEGDHSGVEPISRERVVSGGESGNEMRRQVIRRNRYFNSDFTIRVSNIRRNVRIRDLKAELRKRECNPTSITWKAFRGRCYLHFGNRRGQPSTEEDMQRVMNALSNLLLAVDPNANNNASNANNASGDGNHPPAPQANNQPLVINLNVKLMKNSTRNVNNVANGDVAAGGDASNTHIESVESTSV